MPIYKYKGYKAGGAEAAGTIEADGVKDAASKLKAVGLYPREIRQQADARGAFSGLSKYLSSPTRDRHALPSATRKLSVLLRTGVPLVEALRAISDESAGRWRTVVVSLKERVSGGASLWRAMQDYPEVFQDYYLHMVQAGEESGSLDTVLARLADFLESQNKVKDKVDTAMIYPVIMAGVASIVMVLLFTYVVPKIVGIFEGSSATLPIATRMLLGINWIVTKLWWLLLAVMGGALWYAKRYYETNRIKVDRYLMRTFESLYLARFTRTLGFLLEGGLPITKALELAGKTSGNLWLKEVATGATGMVTEGASLSGSFKGLPPVLVQLVSTGERSGRLPEVLATAAESYEADFDRAVQKALAMLEPAMILVMAGVVLFIVLAILLPIFQLNQLIGR